jgi:uncharacterized membrane protein
MRFGQSLVRFFIYAQRFCQQPKSVKRYANGLVISTAFLAAWWSVTEHAPLVTGKASHFSQKRERCYNIAKAGHNDCATAKHACAAQAVRNKMPDEWIMLPIGLCDRLIDGTTTPPSS